MLLLYIDDAGDLDVPDQHCVVGGLAVCESDLITLSDSVESVRQRVLAPTHWSVEIHAQHIRAGKGRWRTVPADVRLRFLLELAQAVADHAEAAVGKYAAFAVVHSPDAVPHADRMERTYEELLLRFNGLLRRRLSPATARDLGLVVADESKFERVIQPLVTKWRLRGTRRGQLRNIVEVPLFADSQATVMLQIADLIAYSAFRYYQKSDDRLLSVLQPVFDRADDGLIHGLVHLTPDHPNCDCLPCATRRRRRGSAAP